MCSLVIHFSYPKFKFSAVNFHISESEQCILLKLVWFTAKAAISDGLLYRLFVVESIHDEYFHFSLKMYSENSLSFTFT